MKVLLLIECRSCNATIYSSTDKITLQNGDEVEFIVKKIVKCPECKMGLSRTSADPLKQREQQ